MTNNNGGGRWLVGCDDWLVRYTWSILSMYSHDVAVLMDGHVLLMHVVEVPITLSINQSFNQINGNHAPTPDNIFHGDGYDVDILPRVSQPPNYHHNYNNDIYVEHIT
jgi:hypothetical protein